MTFSELIKTSGKDLSFGVVGIILVYFMWSAMRQDARENRQEIDSRMSRMEQQYQTCNDEFRKMLVDQISKSNEVIQANTEAFREFRRKR